jgi:iron complex transport system substrate-binding protein
MINRLLLLCLFLLAGCGKRTQPTADPRGAERIVSMAPNITEILFALGLEDKLVGATAFCTHPPAARDIPRVGGFGQFNYEAIVSLNPDLAILHRQFDDEKRRLGQLGIPCLETDSYYMEDIFTAIRQIGAACGAAPRAGELIREMEDHIGELHPPGEERPRVLLVFGGSAEEDIGQIHAFGTACLHHELLERAGGQNVLTGTKPYSILSREAVLRLDPDLVIILAPELDSTAAELDRWKKMPGLRAADLGRIHVLTGDYLCIPGPRFIRTLEDFSLILEQHSRRRMPTDTTRLHGIPTVAGTATSGTQP